MKRKIRVKFTDMPQEFDFHHNYITRALSRYFEMVHSEHPEFVFYSHFGTAFTRYPNAVKICISGEPILPNFNDCDYAIDYHDLTYGDRHFRAGELLGNVGVPISPQIQDRSFVTPALARRKFCNFVYSNEKNGMGAKLRKDFCQALAKYKAVDCPGTVLHNMEGALEKRYVRNERGSHVVVDETWTASKLQFLSRYKFTIAFENTALIGYTTEKLFHPIQAYSIPIYWGNPDVCQQFNPKAFLNANAYGTDFDALIQQVIALDQDDEQYLSMLKEPPFRSEYSFDEEERLSQFLKKIVENGACPYEKNALGFPNVSAMRFEDHCRLGHVGMKTIAKYITGWIQYKIKRKG